MRRMFCLALITLSLLLAAPSGALSAADPPPGFGAGLFALMGLDARAAALGGAQVAAPEGPATGFYNPAALADASRLQVGGLYGKPYGSDFGVTYQHVSVLGPLGSQTASSRAVGVSVTWMNSRISGIDLWDEQGYSGQAESSASLYLVSLGVRLPRLDTLNLGTSARVYQARLLDGRAAGVGVDLAVLGSILLGETEVRLGANSMNVARSVVTWESSSGKTKNILPWKHKIGIAVLPSIADGLLIAADVDVRLGYPLDEQKLHAGIEYRLGNVAALRGGWQGDVSAGGALSVGVGVQIPGRLVVSYAFIPGRVFGSSHLISASIVF